ncbi:MAG: hypothetical protein HQK53_07800 [Oligoflexia bacterium]|nr:hypothetical protein [Oligoflexia bacterium]
MFNMLNTFKALNKKMRSVFLSVTFASTIFSMTIVDGIFINSARGGIVSLDLEKIQNYPGFIDIDPQSPWYQGNIGGIIRDDGIERRTPSEIIVSYFDQQGGMLNVAKVEELKQIIKEKLVNIFIVFCMENLPPEVMDNNYCKGDINTLDRKLLKKWGNNKYNLIISQSLAHLDQAVRIANDLNLNLSQINSLPARQFLANFFEALEVFEGIKSEDQQKGQYGSGIVSLVANSVTGLNNDRHNTIFKDNPDAANLLVPEELKDRFPNQLFLSLDNLKRLADEGYDLSKLDPQDSGLWIKPQKAINDFDTTTYDGRALDILSKSLNDSDLARKVISTEGIVDMVYEPGRFVGGKSPKFYARINDTKFKVKFLLDQRESLGNFQSLTGVANAFLNASEVHTETAVNNLALAMGFTVDPTFFKRKIRLFFDEESYKNGDFEKSYNNMLDEISHSFNPPMLIRETFKNIKTDEATGRKYIEIKNVSLEKNAEKNTDQNIGFFVRHGLGKSLMREHRGLALFLAWIYDADNKDENDKLKMVPYTNQHSGQLNNQSSDQVNSDKSFKLIYSPSDMGASLGFGLPNYYDTRFIKWTGTNTSGAISSITFNYWGLYKLPIMHAVNFNDAKWIARKMAQFSFAQLNRTFINAGFPEVVAMTYARKMITRRNQLLNALNLIGENITADDGRPFRIVEEEGFTGAIEKYSDLFQGGRLVDPELRLFDPEKEDFPHFWDSHFAVNNELRRETLSIIGLNIINTGLGILVSELSPELRYSAQSSSYLGFTEMRYRDRKWQEACSDNTGSRCYLQGFDYGPGLFMPMRYIVPNPNPKSDRPYLIVDIFRIGVDLGENGTAIQSLLKINVPNNVRFAVGAKFFFVHEFIKVRAMEKSSSYVRNFQELISAPLLSFENFKEEFVDNMREDDALIVSSYVGLKGGLKLTVPVNYAAAAGGFVSAFLPSPYFKLIGEKVLTSRVTLLKKENNQLLANWGILNKSEIEAFLGVRVLILNIPFLSYQGTKLKKMERTYAFDLSKDVEKNILLSNLHAHAPANIPQEYSLAKRQIKFKEHRFKVNFFGLLDHQSAHRKVEVDFEDYLNKTHETEIYLEKEKYLSKLSKAKNLYFKTSVNEEGDMFAKVESRLFETKLTPRKLARFYNKFTPFVPSDFVPFDLNQIKNYSGDHTFFSEIIFSNTALEKIFAVDDKSICIKFAELNQIATEGCNHRVKFNPILASFTHDFREAKYKFKGIKQLFKDYGKEAIQHKAIIYNLMKEISDLLYRYVDNRKVIEVFKSFLGTDDFYHDAVWTSSLEGFPGNKGEIHISEPSAGNFVPDVRHFVTMPEEIFALYSDRLNYQLRQYFYSIDAYAFHNQRQGRPITRQSLGEQ